MIYRPTHKVRTYSDSNIFDDNGQPLTHERSWGYYMHEHCARKGQAVHRVQYVANHVMRIMGRDAEVGRWRRADVDQYETQRRTEGVMGTTIRREQLLWQASLNHNLKMERLDRVPYIVKAEGVGRPRRPMTEEEYKRVMRSPLVYRVRMFFMLAFWTGHRSQAIEQLSWDRVNLEERFINFNDPAMRTTNKRRRDGFPIGDELYTRLDAAYRRPGRDDLVIGRGPRGSISTTYHACKKALRLVGIDEEGLCRHTLRKTYCTERVKLGRDYIKVAESINENPQTMRKNYVQLMAKDLAGVVGL